MVLTIKYDFLKEFSEAINLFLHPDKYQNLRSVIWPTPSTLFSFAISSDKTITHIQDLWRKNSTKISMAFTKLNLKDPGNITCYVHGISCEGWFDIDDNSIHVRFSKSDNNRELLNTIIHEIIHLATYNKKLSYNERENIVEKYLTLISPPDNHR